MHFPIPEGFEFPNDAMEGGEFTAIGTFRDNGDGTLSLIAIDDAPIPEMEEEDDKEEYEEGGKKGMKVEVEIEKKSEDDQSVDGMMRRAMEKGLFKR